MPKAERKEAFPLPEACRVKEVNVGGKKSGEKKLNYKFD